MDDIKLENLSKEELEKLLKDGAKLLRDKFEEEIKVLKPKKSKAKLKQPSLFDYIYKESEDDEQKRVDNNRGQTSSQRLRVASNRVEGVRLDDNQGDLRGRGDDETSGIYKESYDKTQKTLDRSKLPTDNTRSLDKGDGEWNKRGQSGSIDNSGITPRTDGIRDGDTGKSEQLRDDKINRGNGDTSELRDRLVYGVKTLQSRRQRTENDENLKDFSANEELIQNGKKDKFYKNISAINLLKQIGERGATREEQSILAEFSGWGGMSELFNKNNENWNKEREVFYNSLNSAEIQSANSSALNSYYTPKKYN